MKKKKALLLLVLCLAFIKLPAQLCQGSLGDPIINITFGAGPNPGPMLSSTTGNLTYQSADCPDDGYYTVRNNTSSCFKSTWHTLNSDHTGDANGYLVLINGSLQKSEFYLDTVRGLCPNTTYEFAAWVLNLILPTACGGNPKRPNVTFSLEKTDGTVLQTYNTGDIASTQTPEWKQYGFFFTTPSSVPNIVLRMSNNSVGGCGNDFAIDDITFRPCGPQLNASIKGSAQRIKELCAGDTATLTFDCSVSPGYNNPVFHWQQSVDSGSNWTDLPGETATSLVRSFTASTPAGQYLYRLSVGEQANANLASCRVASDFLSVRVNSNPVISILSNSPVCKGGTLKLAAAGADANSKYDWSGINSFSAAGSSVVIANAQAANSGLYFLHVTNANGCQHTDSTTAVVLPIPVITTAFTNKTICQGDSVLLSSAGGINYLWKPSVNLSSATVASPIAKPADSIIYTVIVADANGCADSASVAINVLKKPRVSAGPDKAIIEGQTVQLDGILAGNNATINWSPDLYISNNHSLQPKVNPITNLTYVVTATSSNGCGVSTNSVFVQVYKKVIVPNAFSPNGDGINDAWNIPALATYNNYDLSVFNRYGQIVFATKNYSRPWNGSFNGNILPVGTYYYLLDIKDIQTKLSGFVIILK